MLDSIQEDSERDNILEELVLALDSTQEELELDNILEDNCRAVLVPVQGNILVDKYLAVLVLVLGNILVALALGNTLVDK